MNFSSEKTPLHALQEASPHSRSADFPSRLLGSGKACATALGSRRQSSNFASKHFAMSAPLRAIRSEPPIPRLLYVTVDPSADVVLTYSETVALCEAPLDAPFCCARPTPGASRMRR